MKASSSLLNIRFPGPQNVYVGSVVQFATGQPAGGGGDAGHVGMECVVVPEPRNTMVMNNDSNEPRDIMKQRTNVALYSSY